MEDDSTTAQAATLFAGDAWFDPIEAGIRERIRGFIEALFEEELTAALGRSRCERAVGAPRGYRNGTRERHLLGSFGHVQVSGRRVKRALAALFRGAVGKDVVSRTWHKMKTDWEAWNRRDLAGEEVVRLI